MGTWGTGIFGNDGAADFLDQLADSDNGWALVRETLSTVADADPEDYVEAPDCESALAAAECVAAIRGKPSASAGEQIAEWCRSHPLKDPSKLAGLAAKAVRRIRSSSELKDLWAEGTDQSWVGVLADLEKRLSS